MRFAPALLLIAAHATALADPPRSLEDTVALRLREADSPVCVAVGVVREATRTTFACSPGAGKAAFDGDSIFHIGSVTKGLTGLLLADMVVRGEVRIDDPASSYSRPGAKLPTRGGREITLRDLVTHTSSLPRRPRDFAPRDPANPFGEFDADALYAALARTELTRDIGTQYEYSNLGFMWLSEILARRAGTSFERLLAARVFAPLGMTSTAITLSRDQQARFVKGHDAAYAIVPPWTIGANLEGVGLVASSLNDMLKLAAALAGRRPSPLDAAIALALQPPSPQAAPGVGYAWNIRGQGVRRRHEHGGGAGGFVAHVAFERGRGTAAVVLADAAVPIFDLAIHLVDPAYDLRRRLVTIPLDPRKHREYVGTFALDHATMTVREDGGRLVARIPAQYVVELLPMGRDAFYVQAADVQVVFTRDDETKVDGLTLYLDGRESRAMRVAN